MKIVGEIKESLVLAFDGMLSNKLRSFLASLGVVIGISFVILMGWGINGLDNVLKDTFNSIGNDMIWVDKWSWAGGKNWKLMRQRKNITMKQANEFIKRMDKKVVVIPKAQQWGSVDIKYQNDHFQGISLVGTVSDHAKTSGGAILSGRHFTPFEDKSAANVVVLGYKAWQLIFPSGNGIGETIKIKGQKYQVIGILKKQGTLLFDFMDSQVYIPLNSYFGIYGQNNRSITIGVKAGDIEMDEVRSEIIGVMREIRNLKPGEDDDFSLNESKTFEEQVKLFRQWVWGVGIGMTLLSFIVGIIGIMNIMFVSVTERTKEIGIRKAIGAKNRSIMLQFLTEAATLSLVGAFTAFLLCSGLVFLLATLLPKAFPATSFLSPVIPFDMLFYASVVSIIVGMLAGLIPAMRAASLDPVDALRYE